MKKYLFSFLAVLCCCMFVTGCKSSAGLSHSKDKSIVILYDNDVHCDINGYAKIAGMRDAVSDTAWAAVVSSGDYLQGGTAGAISKGQYIIDVMKHVGYDAVTLGNHEFDYKMDRMFDLLGQLGVPVVNTNLFDLKTGERVFAPYIIKSFGKKKVAFVGATTPTTLKTESYAFFDAEGNSRYDLKPAEVYSLVQQAVDDARQKGADYVVMITHLGEDLNEMNVDSHGMIRSTNGIDVVLDGHTHSVIPTEYVKNKDGKPVLISQTGTQFANIGKLVIMPDGTMTSTLLPVESISFRNARVQQATDSINAQIAAQTGRLVCQSEVDLRILNDAGRQQVRMDETNAGDIVADAFRIMTGADVAMTNGGGIRSEVKKGNLTYGDIVSLLPYDNYLSMVEVTGEKIIEVLTANTSLLPLTDGQFPQVSGIKFTAVVDTHTVEDVQILNQQTGQYEPIDPKKIYTLSTTDYCISGGGFRNVLKDAKVLKDAVMLYNDALVEYIAKKLNGHIGQEYAQPQGRITIKR